MKDRRDRSEFEEYRSALTGAIDKLVTKMDEMALNGEEQAELGEISPQSGKPAILEKTGISAEIFDVLETEGIDPFLSFIGKPLTEAVSQYVDFRNIDPEETPIYYPAIYLLDDRMSTRFIPGHPTGKVPGLGMYAISVPRLADIVENATDRESLDNYQQDLKEEFFDMLMKVNRSLNWRSPRLFEYGFSQTMQTENDGNEHNNVLETLYNTQGSPLLGLVAFGKEDDPQVEEMFYNDKREDSADFEVFTDTTAYVAGKHYLQTYTWNEAIRNRGDSGSARYRQMVSMSLSLRVMSGAYTRDEALQIAEDAVHARPISLVITPSMKEVMQSNGFKMNSQGEGLFSVVVDTSLDKPIFYSASLSTQEKGITNDEDEQLVTSMGLMWIIEPNFRDKVQAVVTNTPISLGDRLTELVDQEPDNKNWQTLRDIVRELDEILILEDKELRSEKISEVNKNLNDLALESFLDLLSPPFKRL